jgi:alpha-tubulin suppressor-like RCC1 family protein
MFSRIIALVIVLSTGINAAEYWSGLNKEGDQRNSNAQSLSGNLRVRWSTDIRGLGVSGQYFGGQKSTGRRSYNLAVRDGRILLVVPTTDPAATNHPYVYVTYGTYSLATGSLLSAALSPHAGPLYEFGADTNDIRGGTICHYWKADGTVYTKTGGDMAQNARFNPYTGEVPFGFSGAGQKLYGKIHKMEADSSWVNHGVDASGLFAMTESNPSIFAAGHAGSGAFTLGNNAYGLLDIATLGAGDYNMAYHNGFLVAQDFVYTFKTTTQSSSINYGTQIEAVRLQGTPSFSVTRPWTCKDNLKCFLPFIGGPRAYCIAEDGRIYYYAYKLLQISAATAPDWAAGTVLTGVRTLDGVADTEIPVAYDLDKEFRSMAGSGITSYEQLPHPQIAALGTKVIVFVPPQKLNYYDVNSPAAYRGHVFCFDTATKSVAWRHDYAAGSFSTHVVRSDLARDRSQAVQMTIAGDSAYVVEPRLINGSLVLRTDRFNLATGSRTTTDLPVLTSAGQIIPVADDSTPALREVAAVDGKLVCLVDYDYLYQALVVVEGDASVPIDYAPIAVITSPVTGTKFLHQRPVSDYKLPASNSFDSDVLLTFDGRQSVDPDGGALTYLWDFGDGATSTLPTATHVYAASGNFGTTINRTVTLTVRDNEGQSASTSRVLAIRNVGTVQTLVYSAVADSYVDSYSTVIGNNFGAATKLVAYRATNQQQRGYVRFDLQSAVPGNIISATLRLWAPPIAPGINNTLYVRQSPSAWTENGITWNNAPAPGNVVGLKRFEYYPQYGYFVDVPVTQYVRSTASEGQISFALDANALVYPGVTLGTKEAGTPPQLILQVGNAGYQGPVIVTQPQANVAGLPQETTTGTALGIAAQSPLGESALTYNWQIVSGPGEVTFVPNNSNAAKSTKAKSATAGTYTLQCVVSDGLQSVVSQVVTYTPSFTVNPPPTVSITAPANNATFTAPASITFSASASDSNGSVTKVEFFRGTSLIGTATTAPYNFVWSNVLSGTYSITAKATDNAGATSTSAPVNITVISANRAPVANNQSITLPEDTAKSIVLSATDADGHSLTYSIVTMPVHGTLSGVAPNLTYSPAENYYGSDSFSFRASDGQANSNTAIMTLSITSVNDAPVAAAQSVSTVQDTPISITLTGSDLDLGQSLTFVIAVQPAHGSLSGTPPNVTYTPAAGFSGNDIFAFKVNDGLVDSNHAIVTINVTPTILTGTLAAWGHNLYGQLGDGSTLQRRTPVAVAGLSGVRSVACGAFHTLALMEDGTVRAWGNNTYGQLGTGNTISTTTPVLVPGLTGVKAIAVGAYHNLALLQDGTVRSWGYNNFGAIGDGSAVTRNAPVSIVGLNNVRNLAAGGYHSVAILNDGTLKAWGHNAYGQLGDGSAVHRTSPVSAIGISGVNGIACGMFHTAAVCSDGSVRSWGSNAYGQLGNGTTIDSRTPVVATVVSNVKSITCGAYCSLILLNDGTVQGSGDNRWGGLGVSGVSTFKTFTPISDLNNVTAIAAGYYHGVALIGDGTIKTWGFNAHGELGDGSTVIWRPAPQPVPGISGARVISAAGYQTLALGTFTGLPARTILAGADVLAFASAPAEPPVDAPDLDAGIIDLGTVNVNGAFNVKLPARVSMDPATVKKARWMVLKKGTLPKGVRIKRDTVGGTSKTTGVFTFEVRVKSKTYDIVQSYRIMIIN